jgi:drug/metabolite transporter (DMT)-like permease
MGETLALLTAVTWAVAVIFFKKSGETVHPIALNWFKDVLAALLFVPTAWLMGETLLLDAPVQDYLLMLAGGVIGIAVADTMFFVSLNLLGAGLTAIVDCLYAPSVIALSMIVLGEELTIVQGVGSLLIVAAVLSPVFEANDGRHERKKVVAGILWGAASLLMMAVSIVVVKPLLDRSPLLWACEMRMLGGVLGLTVFLALYPGRRQVLSSLLGAGRKHTLAGALIGGYLSLVLWLAGMKFTQASIAAALNQSSNIFLFLLAVAVLHERLTRIRLAGIVLGMAGVLLVSFG